MKYLLDPTGELDPITKTPLKKIKATPSTIVGLIDISKAKGDIFLDRIEKLFKKKGLQTKRYKKPTFARPAPISLIQQITTEVNVVVQGLADWGSCTSCSLQDIRELDARGVPGGFVASEPFKASADSHAKSLGFDADGVFVTHPIQDRTNDELDKLAERYFNDIFKLVFDVD